MISPLITRGIGFGGVHFLPTLGFGSGTAEVVQPSSIHRIYRLDEAAAGSRMFKRTALLFDDLGGLIDEQTVLFDDLTSNVKGTPCIFRPIPPPLWDGLTGKIDDQSGLVDDLTRPTGTPSIFRRR